MPRLAAGTMAFAGDTAPYPGQSVVLPASPRATLVDGTTDLVTGLLSTIAVYPLTLIITRVQAQRKQNATSARTAAFSEDEPSSESKGGGGPNGNVNTYGDLLQMTKEIYETEGGLKSLYAGCLDATGKVALRSVIRLAVSTILHGRLRERELPVIRRTLAAMLSEMAAISLTAPLETVITRKQLQGLSQRSFGRSTEQTISEIRNKEGLTALWSGYDASLALLLNLPLSLLALESLRNTLPSRATAAKRSDMMIYLLWVVSYAAASSITYPLSVLRTKAQAPRFWRSDAEDKNSLPHGLHETLRAEGPGALYTGVMAHIIRIFACHGTAGLLRSLIATSLSQYISASPAVPDQRAGVDGYTISRANGSFSKSYAVPAGDLANVARMDHTRFYAPDYPGNMAKRRYMNETAELVGDYVEDETEDWRSFYHWFWDPERRRNED